MRIEIVHTSNPGEASALAKIGYEPIECSFGQEGSVLGPLAMDHHGAESWREGVALRAYLDHFGARASDPRFVVTGDADADATFAIAALCGLLPHPSRKATLEAVKNPGWMISALTQDMRRLAQLVNLLDTDPFAVRLNEHPDGPLHLLWDQMASGVEDASAFHAGVDRWRKLTGPSAPKVLLVAALEEEEERVKVAREAEAEKISETVGFVEGAVYGFDIWYTEHPGTPVIVAYVPENGNVTVGCRDLAAAERIFGKGGLKNVFGALEPKTNGGWGGRETVGGGPRGLRLTREQARIAAETIARLAKG